MDEFKERQKRENTEHYQKWLSCGFVGEMVVDDSGWCILGNNLAGEKIQVFDKGYLNRATISYMQLPNKNWISGSDAFCRTHGHGHGLSIWNKQFNTKEEAIEEALNWVENEIDEKDKKTLAKKVEEIRSKFKKDILFVPIVAEQFEHVSLF